MRKDLNINKKILKKFLYLLDRGMAIEACLEKFPDDREKLKAYAEIISSFNNLKNIKVDSDFENNSLKNIYSRARVENYEKTGKISRKDMFFIRLRPAYFKPLIIFLGFFIFMSFSFAGTLYASESSLPGDTLYTFKRTSENIHIAITPDKHKKALYLKLLEKRLVEADSVLVKDYYIDASIAEKIISDIDTTYNKCRKRNYLNVNQDSHMQMRIRGIKEGFKYRGGSQGNGVSNCPNQAYEEEVSIGSCMDTSGTAVYQNNSENSSSADIENKFSSNSSENTEAGKKNQYSK